MAHLFNQIRIVDNDKRSQMGQTLNNLKTEITKEIVGLVPYQDNIVQRDTDIDFTLPGDPLIVGSIHPLTQVLEEIKAIFIRLGFSVAFKKKLRSKNPVILVFTKKIRLQ